MKTKKEFTEDLINEIDLFENYEMQPENLKAILSKIKEEQNSFEFLEALKKECEKIGFTFDYDLGGYALNLVPISLDAKVNLYNRLQNEKS